MRIDLNDESDFTVENVAKLIASKDDSQHCQLRVTSDGFAYLSDDIGNQNLDGLAFRFETWCAGNDYVGIKASQTKDFVQKVYDCLRKNWPNPTSTYIDKW